MYSKVNELMHNLIKKSTPDRPKWNIEVALGHISPGWNYVDGCMIKAVLDIYEATNDKFYIDFAHNFIDYYVSAYGSILGYKLEDYNSDHINEGKVLFTLLRHFDDNKYKKALDMLYRQLMGMPRTKSGNFWHKLIYPEQVWLDGLYMTMPFYAEYEILFNEGKNINDILTQFKNVYDNMKDKKTGLLYHGIDEAHECFWADPMTGLSKNFWSRSIGWFIMALLDTAEKLDDAHSADRETLISYLKHTVDALLHVFDKETGMLWQVTNMADKSGNYLETSSSCALAYVLMKGARLGYLPDNYFDYGKKIFDSVTNKKLIDTDDGVALIDICLVAGLGVYPGRGDYKKRDGTYEYYISEPRVNNDAKGVAPFLMAYAELLRKEIA